MLACAGYYGPGMLEAHNVATYWRTTEAEVIASGVRTGCGGHGDGRPEVQYRYEIDGVRYTNSRVHLGKAYCGTAAADRAAAWPVGAKPMVHFNPTDPTQSVLQPFPGKGGYHLSVIMMAMLFAGLALPAVVAARRMRSRDPRQ
jgi:hypothetical protein